MKEINDLPEEILSYILGFLPYTYLQDARLVCRRWYTASLHPSLISRDVICLQRLARLPFDFLLKSKRQFWNLCFKGYIQSCKDVEDTLWSDWFLSCDEKFWSCCGSHLRTLSFYGCDITRHQLGNILSFCSELRSIEISACRLRPRREEEIITDYKCWPKLLHLESLAINGRFGEYCDDNGEVFDNLLSSTANLKSLLLVNCMVPRGKFGAEYLTPEHVLHFVQKNCKKIVNVSFVCAASEAESVLIDLLMTPNLELQRLEVHHLDEELAKITNRLKSLKVLKLHYAILGVGADEKILNDLHNLQSLEIVSGYVRSPLISLRWLKNLTSLTLKMSFHVEDSDVLRALCSEVNTTLKRLSLSKDSQGTVALQPYPMQPQIIATLAETYPALTEFEFDWNRPSDWDLCIPAIFKYQVSLQSLRLTNLMHLTTVGLNGGRSLRPESDEDESTFGHSIARLKHLWKLDLEDGCNPGTSFKNVILPELRDLSLTNFMLPEDFSIFLKKHPRLERLYFNDVRYIQNDTVDVIVGSLPRLKYVSINLIDFISEENLTKLRQFKIHWRTRHP